jgi:hypothetical protein
MSGSWLRRPVCRWCGSSMQGRQHCLCAKATTEQATQPPATATTADQHNLSGNAESSDQNLCD